MPTTGLQPDVLLTTLRRQGGASLYLTIGDSAQIEVADRMVSLKTKPISADDTAGLMIQWFGNETLDSVTDEPMELSLESDDGHFRVRACRRAGGVQLAVRPAQMTTEPGVAPKS